MDIGTLLLLIVWLAIGLLAARWMLKLPVSQTQKVALSSIGLLAMISLGGIMLWVYSVTSLTFGGKVLTYKLTHSIKTPVEFRNSPGKEESVLASFTMYDYQGKRTIFPGNKPDKFVTIFRPGEVSYGTLNGDTLNVDTKRTATRTSFWWMLWDTKYYNATESVQ